MVLTAEDFGGDLGPSLPEGVNDTVAPILTLKGLQTMKLVVFKETFEEPGYVATDAIDGAITDVQITGDTLPIDTSVIMPDPGHIITYVATDAAGNSATESRNVIVYDPCPAPERMCEETLACSIMKNCDPNAAALGSALGGAAPPPPPPSVPLDEDPPKISLLGAGELFEVQNGGVVLFSGIFSNVPVGGIFKDPGKRRGCR